MQVQWYTHTKNIDIRNRIEEIAGPIDCFLGAVIRKKLTWFGHVQRAKGTLANTILQGTVEGSRTRGRPRRQWIDDIVKWTGEELGKLARMAEDRVVWRRLVSRCVASTAPG